MQAAGRDIWAAGGGVEGKKKYIYNTIVLYCVMIPGGIGNRIPLGICIYSRSKHCLLDKGRVCGKTQSIWLEFSPEVFLCCEVCP